MIRLWVLFIIAVMFSSLSDAQTKPALTRLNLKAELNQRYSFQFSCIVIKNDSLILVAEKCGKVYILNKHSLDIISVRNDLPLNQTESIEGAVLYRNRYLFLLDENKVAVFSYDLEGRIPFKKIAGKELLGDSNKGLLEGIAINEEQSICYILPESGTKIFLFDIQSDMRLTKKQNSAEINLPNKGWTRNTDLYYEKRRLYILATDYTSTNSSPRYAIDFYSLDSMGQSLTSASQTIDLTSCRELSDNKNFSLNLEGLAKDASNFYIISDNDQSDIANCGNSTTARLSLLFKFNQ